MMLATSPYETGLEPIYGEIQRRVDARRDAFTSLWERFDLDSDNYYLKSFDGEKGHEDFQNMEENGYRTYTSPMPKVFANKMKDSITGAVFNILIPSSREIESQRMINQLARDFLAAALKQADERLESYMEAPVLDQKAFDTCVRGHFAGRVLLRRRLDGSTMVDVTPWDPRGVVWQLGSDGLEWACHITRQTYAEVKAKHPEVRPLTTEEYDDTREIDVYDYYDGDINCVFSSGLEIKAMTPHGAPSIPVYAGYVVEAPNRRTDYGREMMRHVGESVFSESRDIIPKQNFLMSLKLHYSAKSMSETLVYESEDGTKDLEGDPFTENSVVKLARGEKLEPLAKAMDVKETNEALLLVGGDMQRATLPWVAYGDSTSSVSGYQTEILQKGYLSKLTPRITAVERGYKMICRKLLEQYATGIFAPIPIPGRYDQHMPQMVAMADPVEVTLKPTLPRDMAADVSTASMAKEAGLFSYADIMEKIMQLDDVEGLENRKLAEEAGMLIPTATMYNLYKSSLERGEEVQANEYLMEYQFTRMEQMLRMMMLQFQVMQAMAAGLGPPGGEGGAAGGGQPIAQALQRGGGGGGPGGVNNAVRPQQTLGFPQTPPTPQAGPVVPAGTPRPGARSPSLT